MLKKRVLITVISLLLAMIISSVPTFATTDESGDTQPQATVNYLAGDVDGNGTVTIRDVTVYQLILVGKMETTEAFLTNYDTLLDYKSNIRDATIIQMYLVGKYTMLPISTDGYYAGVFKP